MLEPFYIILFYVYWNVTQNDEVKNMNRDCRIKQFSSRSHFNCFQQYATSFLFAVHCTTWGTPS